MAEEGKDMEGNANGRFLNLDGLLKSKIQTSLTLAAVAQRFENFNDLISINCLKDERLVD